MNNLFLELLNRSITASLLMILVIALHFILRKMPKNVNCILWLLVGIRLICPVSIESMFSVLPSKEPVQQMFDNVTTITTNTDIVNLEDNQLNATTNQSQKMDSQPNLTKDLPRLCAIIWFCGFIGMSGYTMLGFYKLKKRVRESIPYKEQIFLCDHIDTPFILGILKPKIYLPSDILEDQIPYVLQHEKAHLKRLDPLWKVVGYTILIFHWFNPLVWISYKLFCKDLELACDEKVIRSFNSIEKKAYSTILLECSVKKSTFSLSPLAFGEISVKDRVKAILSYKKPAFWTILIAIVICIVVGICFLTNPIRQKEYSDEELVSMAAQFYLMNSGRDYLYLPEQIEVSTLAEKGQVVLSLYDIIGNDAQGGHGVTWAVYQVDRNTAVGYETRSFDAVDLSKIEENHDFQYHIMEGQEGVWQLDLENLNGIETNPEKDNIDEDGRNSSSEGNAVNVTDVDQAKMDVLERFQKVLWEELEAKDLMFTGDLFAKPTEIQCIGEIPEQQIKLYGYGDNDYQGVGVAIQIGEDVNFFDWTYTSPRGLPPSVYWNDKDKVLQIALKIYTGTGIAAEELHILRQYETGTLDDAIFAFDDYSSLLQQMVGFQYLEEEQKLQLITLSDDSILSEIENIVVPNGMDSLELGMISSFLLGDNIWLQVEPGYIPKGQIAEYEGMPTLMFPVQTKVDDSNNTLFQLGEPQVIDLGEEP